MLYLDPDKHAATGLPRQCVEAADGDGWRLRPVPWTNNDDRWGALDTDRAGQCMEHSLCLVCGERVAQGRVLVSKDDTHLGPPHTRYRKHHLDSVLDGGPLHERCFKLTEAHCGTIRRKLREGTIYAPRYDV